MVVEILSYEIRNLRCKMQCVIRYVVSFAMHVRYMELKNINPKSRKEHLAEN